MLVGTRRSRRRHRSLYHRAVLDPARVSPARFPEVAASSSTRLSNPAVSRSSSGAFCELDPSRRPESSGQPPQDRPSRWRSRLGQRETLLPFGRAWSPIATSSIIIGARAWRDQLDHRLAERFETSSRGPPRRSPGASDQVGRVVAHGPPGDRVPGAPWAPRRGRPAREAKAESVRPAARGWPAGKKLGSSATRAWSGFGPIGAICVARFALSSVKRSLFVSGTPPPPGPCDTDEALLTLVKYHGLGTTSWSRSDAEGSTRLHASEPATGTYEPATSGPVHRSGSRR